MALFGCDIYIQYIINLLTLYFECNENTYYKMCLIYCKCLRTNLIGLLKTCYLYHGQLGEYFVCICDKRLYFFPFFQTSFSPSEDEEGKDD